MSTYNGEQVSEGASLTQEQEDALQAASYITVNDPSVTLSSVDGVASYTVGSDPIAGRTNSAYAQQHFQYVTGTSKYSKFNSLGLSVEGVNITDGGGTSFGYLKNVGAGQVNLSCNNTSVSGVSDLNEVQVTSIDCTGDADFVDINATESVTVGTVFTADNTAQTVSGTRFEQTAVTGLDPEDPTLPASLVTKHYCDKASPYTYFARNGYQLVPDATNTRLLWTETGADVGGAFTLSSGVITVNYTGLYCFGYKVHFLNPDYAIGTFNGLLSYNREARVSRNMNLGGGSASEHVAFDEVNYWYPDGQYGRDKLAATGFLYLNAGDTLDVIVQATTVTTNIPSVDTSFGRVTNNWSLKTKFWARYVGA